MQEAWLFLAGLAVGILGILVGVGGGMFVVPLLMFHLGFAPEQATAASLVVVSMSALSGTAANTRRRRIDFRTGLVLAAGTLPGAWLGRHVVGNVSHATFDILFGGLMFLASAYLAFMPRREGRGLLRGRPCRVVDSEGQEHAYEINEPLGFVVSLGTGLVSSFFGVGGGVVHVPLLIIVFGVPILVAAATAQFTFIFTTGLGVLEAARQGQLGSGGWSVALTMGVGVVLGAQLGVAAGKRVRRGFARGVLAALLAVVAGLMILRGAA